MENRHDVMETGIAGAERMPELVEEAVQPGIRAEHAGTLDALLFLVERILQR
jgi:hypothetical protein